MSAPLHAAPANQRLPCHLAAAASQPARAICPLGAHFAAPRRRAREARRRPSRARGSPPRLSFVPAASSASRRHRPSPEHRRSAAPDLAPVITDPRRSPPPSPLHFPVAVQGRLCLDPAPGSRAPPDPVLLGLPTSLHPAGILHRRHRHGSGGTDLAGSSRRRRPSAWAAPSRRPSSPAPPHPAQLPPLTAPAWAGPIVLPAVQPRSASSPASFARSAGLSLQMGQGPG